MLIILYLISDIWAQDMPNLLINEPESQIQPKSVRFADNPEVITFNPQEILYPPHNEPKPESISKSVGFSECIEFITFNQLDDSVERFHQHVSIDQHPYSDTYISIENLADSICARIEKLALSCKGVDLKFNPYIKIMTLFVCRAETNLEKMKVVSKELEKVFLAYRRYVDITRYISKLRRLTIRYEGFVLDKKFNIIPKGDEDFTILKALAGAKPEEIRSRIAQLTEEKQNLKDLFQTILSEYEKFIDNYDFMSEFKSPEYQSSRISLLADCESKEML